MAAEQKGSAALGMIIIALFAYGAWKLSDNPPPPKIKIEEVVTIDRGNALACRDRADMERVIAELRTGNQATYMNVVSDLLIFGWCTEISRGSSVAVLEKFPSESIARVRKWDDQTEHWVNLFYVVEY